MKIKILFLTFLASILISNSSIQAAIYQPYHQIEEVKFASYPGELKPIVQMIMRMPEIRSLVALAQQQGPIKIKIDKNRNDYFGGYWDPSNRTIVLDGKNGRNPGKMMSTLIFELHNVLSTDRFNHLNDQASKGLISKDYFVRETEWIEHQNLVNCSKLISAGIRNLFLPRNASLPIIRDFEKHYQVQQLNGHSDYLAWSFDHLTPHRNQTFNGTVYRLTYMSAQQKDELLNQIVSQHLEDPS